MSIRRPIRPATILLILTLSASGCQTVPNAVPPSPEIALLGQVNAAVNRRARPCPEAVCLEDWPEVADLEQVCELARFTAGVRVVGRLPVAVLPDVRQALRAAGSAATGR